jgi:hypothetical protein
MSPQHTDVFIDLGDVFYRTEAKDLLHNISQDKFQQKAANVVDALVSRLRAVCSCRALTGKTVWLIVEGSRPPTGRHQVQLRELNEAIRIVAFEPSTPKRLRQAKRAFGRAGVGAQLRRSLWQLALETVLNGAASHRVGNKIVYEVDVVHLVVQFCDGESERFVQRIGERVVILGRDADLLATMGPHHLIASQYRFQQDESGRLQLEVGRLFGAAAVGSVLRERCTKLFASAATAPDDAQCLVIASAAHFVGGNDLSG